MTRRHTELSPDLAELADAQHGVVTRAQVVAAAGRAGLRALVGVGVLVDGGYRGVYAVAGSRRTRRRDLSAVLAAAGQGARAAEQTVLALAEVPPFALVAPFVIAVPTTRRIRTPDCRVLRSDVPAHARTTLHDLASTTVDWALLSLARGGVHATIPTGVKRTRGGRNHRVTVREAIDEAFRLEWSNSDQLRQLADAHRRHPGGAALRRAFDGATFEQENDAERRLGRLFRPGDPQPRWQVWVLPDVRADGALLDARITLEYHSRTWHLQAGDQDRDAARRLKLAAADIVEIPVTAGMLRDEAEQTRRRILAAYARQLAAGVAPLEPCDPPARAR